MAENPKVPTHDEFMDEVAASLQSLNTLYDLHGRFAAEEYGLNIHDLEGVIGLMVQVDGLKRIEERMESMGIASTIPLPEDIIEICLKTFMLGFIYARREMTREEA